MTATINAASRAARIPALKAAISLTLLSSVILLSKQNMGGCGQNLNAQQVISAIKLGRIMTPQKLVPVEFWFDLERDVASRVTDALNTDEVPRELLISYLRDLEVMARTACDRRETVQIIASGRSLLGDRKVMGPQDCAFSYAPL